MKQGKETNKAKRILTGLALLASNLIAGAVEAVTGAKPALGTTGGTSDARFIKDHAPVAELGLLNTTAHKVDERVSVADLERLSAIYGSVLDGYFDT